MRQLKTLGGVRKELQALATLQDRAGRTSLAIYCTVSTHEVFFASVQLDLLFAHAVADRDDDAPQLRYPTGGFAKRDRYT